MQQTAMCQALTPKLLRGLAILVSDPKLHNVCYSQMGRCWLLENAQDGLVSIHNSFAEAISAMQRAVGLNGSGYDWTFIPNPYFDPNNTAD